MVLNMLLFWTEVQVLNFQYRKGIIPFELHSHWEHHFSMSYSPLKVPAEQLGVLWLEGQNRVGWHLSAGILWNASWEISKSKKGIRKGGGSQKTAIKNSSLPKGSPVRSMGPFGARAERDGRLWEERDGPCKSIGTNEPCWKHRHKQRAGFAGQWEQSGAGCLLLAHRGTLWF